jgi:tetratricopeptide (TPR) repeat protein
MNRLTIGLAALLLAVLVAGSGPAAAGTPETDKASKHVERGFKALESDDLDRARTYFGKALKLVPSLPDAHLGMGHLAMRDGRFEDALAEYQAAREGHAELADELHVVEMERYHERRRQIPRLQQELNMLKTGELTMSASDRRFRVQEIEDMIREIQNTPPPMKEAAEEAPGEMDFHTGNALLRLRRFDEAIEAYEACTRKSPSFAPAYNNLALAYWRSGSVGDALKALGRAEEQGLEVNAQLKADLERSR